MVKPLSLQPVEITAGGQVVKVTVGGAERRVYAAIPGWEVEFLDKSGDTLPRHFYDDVLPALAVFIAPRSGQPAGSAAGDDVAGDGTIGKPYASIQKALSSTTATRNVVVCRGGIIGGPGHAADAHYSGIFNARSFTIQAYRDEDPFFDGNHEVDNFGIFASSGAQMDQIIQGIGLQGFIGSVSSANAGAIYFSSGTNGGACQIFRDFVVRDIDGIGVNWFKPRGDRGAACERGVLRDSDSTLLTGTHNFGSSFQPGVEPTWAFRNDMRFAHLYMTGANRGDHRSPGEGYPNDIGGNAGSFQAAAKIHGYLGCLFFGCLIEGINDVAPKGPGGYGTGIWYDVGNRESDIVSCYAERCARSAYFWEVGSTGRAVSCIAKDCGRGKNFSNFRIASPYIQLWNCLSIGGASSIEVYDDIRSLASDGYGWDTQGEQMHNCLWIGPTSGPNAESFLMRLYDNGQKAGGTGTNPPDYFSAASGGSWSRNAWLLGGTSKVVRWDQTPPGNQTYSSPQLLHDGDATHAAHPECGSGDLLLAGALSSHLDAGLNAVPSSPIFGAGLPLPADIAGLLGLPAGFVPSIGPIFCPGMN